MSKGVRYPSHDILDRYIPVRDIHDYYEDIDIEKVEEFITNHQVHYAELKDPKGSRRIPHVDMKDVLLKLGKDPTIKHPPVDRGVPFA